MPQQPLFWASGRNENEDWRLRNGFSISEAPLSRFLPLLTTFTICTVIDCLSIEWNWSLLLTLLVSSSLSVCVCVQCAAAAEAWVVTLSVRRLCTSSVSWISWFQSILSPLDVAPTPSSQFMTPGAANVGGCHPTTRTPRRCCRAHQKWSSLAPLTLTTMHTRTKLNQPNTIFAFSPKFEARIFVFLPLTGDYISEFKPLLWSKSLWEASRAWTVRNRDWTGQKWPRKQHREIVETSNETNKKRDFCHNNFEKRLRKQVITEKTCLNRNQKNREERLQCCHVFRALQLLQAGHFFSFIHFTTSH